MFICFEGIAGSGKTTQTKLLSDYLRNIKNIKVFESAAFEGVRRNTVSAFMNQTGIKSDANAIMFLFQALHATHYKETLQALERNEFVIADRWRHAFISYHTYHNTFGHETNLIHQLDKLAYRSLEPDIYFLIDMPAELAFQRYMEREIFINDNSLEFSNISAFKSINEYYRQLSHHNNWRVVDGTQSKEIIFAEIKTIIDNIL